MTNISLPPGKYIATATANVGTVVFGAASGTGYVQVDCYFPVEIEADRRVGRVFREGTTASLALTVEQALPITAAIDLSGASGPTTVSMGCRQNASSGNPTSFTFGTSISAVKVGTLIAPAG